jgi:hypothetical protein
MDSKMVNVSSPPLSSSIILCLLIFEVMTLIQADKLDRSSFEVLDLFYFYLFCDYVLKFVGGGFELPCYPWLTKFLCFVRHDNNSLYIMTTISTVISYVELFQVNSSYICLALFPAIMIGFILVLRKKLNRRHGSQQCDDGEASTGSGGDLGSGKEMKKAEGQEHGEASAGHGGDLLGGGTMEMNKAEVHELVTDISCWMFYIIRQFLTADNFTVSLFLLFLSFNLGALTEMVTRLMLSGVAPGGTPASALLRKASLLVLLVAVHAVAVEFLGEQVVLFILPELAPLLLWLSVHIDRAKEGPIVTAHKIALNRNVLIFLITVALPVVLACVAVTMDESIFSWVAKVVVSCGSSGHLVCYFAFMIPQWQGQDANATPFLEETVKLLKIWTKVLLITAAALVVPTSVAAVRLDLYEQMRAAPVEFFNKYVTPTSAL